MEKRTCLEDLYLPSQSFVASLPLLCAVVKPRPCWLLLLTKPRATLLPHREEKRSLRIAAKTVAAQSKNLPLELQPICYPPPSCATPIRGVLLLPWSLAIWEHSRSFADRQLPSPCLPILVDGHMKWRAGLATTVLPLATPSCCRLHCLKLAEERCYCQILLPEFCQRMRRVLPLRLHPSAFSFNPCSLQEPRREVENISMLLLTASSTALPC